MLFRYNHLLLLMKSSLEENLVSNVNFEKPHQWIYLIAHKMCAITDIKP